MHTNTASTIGGLPSEIVMCWNRALSNRDMHLNHPPLRGMEWDGVVFCLLGDTSLSMFLNMDFFRSKLMNPLLMKDIGKQRWSIPVTFTWRVHVNLSPDHVAPGFPSIVFLSFYIIYELGACQLFSKEHAHTIRAQQHQVLLWKDGPGEWCGVGKWFQHRMHPGALP